MRRLMTAFAATLCLSQPALAQDCIGRNLIAELPQDARQELDRAVADIPFRQGLIWKASKGDQRITLVGTYHFQDPRHDKTMSRLDAAFADAAFLMVEAGPSEEAQLAAALAKDPSLTVLSEGPTLPERLSPEEWATLSAAMTARGMPAVIAAKLRPWYVAMMLGISPCMLKGIAANGGEVHGLDHMLIERAAAAHIPVRALEPWDTIFTLFADMTPEQEDDMIRTTLPAAAYADDFAVTMADAYFNGDVWSIWEFGRIDAYRNSGLSRAEVDDQMALAKTKLMDERNAGWIGALEKAAAEAALQGRGVIAGFGALHLPGDQGVLRLLEQDGWRIIRQDG